MFFEKPWLFFLVISMMFYFFTNMTHLSVCVCVCYFPFYFKRARNRIPHLFRVEWKTTVGNLGMCVCVCSSKHHFEWAKLDRGLGRCFPKKQRGRSLTPLAGVWLGHRIGSVLPRWAAHEPMELLQLPLTFLCSGRDNCLQSAISQCGRQIHANTRKYF